MSWKDILFGGLKSMRIQRWPRRRIVNRRCSLDCPGYVHTNPFSYYSPGTLQFTVPMYRKYLMACVLILDQSGFWWRVFSFFYRVFWWRMYSEIYSGTVKCKISYSPRSKGNKEQWSSYLYSLRTQTSLPTPIWIDGGHVCRSHSLIGSFSSEYDYEYEQGAYI